MIRNILSLLLIEELLRFRHLLAGLVGRSLKAVYTGSMIGAAWVYFKPLIVILAYYFVFDQVLSIRLDLESSGTGSYALYLLSGLLPWLVFSDAVIEGATSLVREAELLKKTRFPIVLIPAKSVITAAVKIFPLLLLIWLVSVVTAEGRVHGVVLLALWIAVQIQLTYYIAIMLAIMSAALRDVGLLVESIFPMLLFFSPVLYPLDKVPDAFQWLLWLNPFTPLAQGYHAILLRGEIPALFDLAVVGSWILVTLLICHLLLRRSQEYLVDWL
ncbi:MAG: ABC transporter permease [Candidatus Thiodiazotropha sp.]